MSQKKVNIDVNTIDLDNTELQKALQIIQFTNNSLFLTGKAGTGKSTFLRYIAATTKKKHIILCLLYTSPSPRDYAASRMPSSA